MDDHQWAAAFTAAAQRRNLDAAAIRGVLDQVAQHGARTNQSAFQAFGDPTIYASAMPAPPVPRAWMGAIMFALIGLTWLVGVMSAYSFGNGGEFPITLGMVVCTIITIAVSPFLFGSSAKDAAPKHPMRSMLPLLGLGLAWTTILPRLTSVVLRPTLLPLFTSIAIVGIVLMVGSALAARYTSGATKDRWTKQMMMSAFGLAVVAVTSPVAYYIGLVL